MIAGIAGNIVRGNYIAIPIVFLLLAFVIVAIWVAILFNRRQIQAMFRHPTPDKLIEHYHASQLRARARNIPNADAAAADLSSSGAPSTGNTIAPGQNSMQSNGKVLPPPIRFAVSTPWR